jgi:glutamyl-tRNA synthetase
MMIEHTGTDHAMPGEPRRVVRFAPSPTGHLHIGGVRTALFNYFFIKNLGGTFVLRIEDTDISRSSKEMADEIIKGMQWMGIHWDEGPFYQSDFFESYRETAFQLLEEGNAYRCFCTPEEIEARKAASESEDKSLQLYKYDRKCMGIPSQEIQRKLQRDIPFVIRFKVPDGATYFKDRIHKQMKTENSELEDFVILKSDNSPTYHLSVVVDDSRMEISDVIRGDDHISNTFKQVLLFQALNRKPPKYAHLPLILGADKKKLSKRHGQTSVLEFKRAGYLPEALINYLSQLSWLPADNKTIVSTGELIRQFKLNKLSKNSPVFDYDKLRFMNGKAIQQKDSRALYRLLTEDPGFDRAFAHVDTDKKVALIELVKPRMKTLEEFEKKFHLFLADSINYGDQPGELEKLNESYDNESVIRHLRLLLPELEKMEDFGRDAVETMLRENAERNGLKAADFIHPARFALTSETVSPSIFDVFAFFGKDKAMERINGLIRYLEQL